MKDRITMRMYCLIVSNRWSLVQILTYFILIMRSLFALYRFKTFYNLFIYLFISFLVVVAFSTLRWRSGVCKCSLWIINTRSFSGFIFCRVLISMLGILLQFMHSHYAFVQLVVYLFSKSFGPLFCFCPAP